MKAFSAAPASHEACGLHLSLRLPTFPHSPLTLLLSLSAHCLLFLPCKAAELFFNTVVSFYVQAQRLLGFPHASRTGSKSLNKTSRPFSCKLQFRHTNSSLSDANFSDEGPFSSPAHFVSSSLYLWALQYPEMFFFFISLTINFYLSRINTKKKVPCVSLPP